MQVNNENGSLPRQFFSERQQRRQFTLWRYNNGTYGMESGFQRKG